ncbi:MAG TPA: nuclear transport factor 2 family protein [Terracidiphilus sp.]|nr:nuclear transport factor 2 family protein [Terracidiphilus sp.]
MSSATLHAPASIDEAEILDLLSSIYKAHHDKDAAGIAAPFAPHAAIFDLQPPLAHDGISVERKERWLATWDGPVEIEPRDFQLTISGDHAVGWGYLKMTGTKHGGPHVSFWMRETVALARTAGQWRIVHEHTSVPFYMDASLRPAFDLQP